MNALGRIASALATAALAGGLASPVLAADTVTVTAQVTMAAPCLTSGQSTIDFGAQLFSPDGGPPHTSGRPISFANCGTAVEQIYIRATNAAAVGGGATWSLILPGAGCPALGLNRFALVASATGADINVSVTPNDRQIDLVPPGSSGQFDQLTLTTPCQGSDGAGSIMSFNVVYTATF